MRVRRARLPQAVLPPHGAAVHPGLRAGSRAPMPVPSAARESLDGRVLVSMAAMHANATATTADTADGRAHITPGICRSFPSLD
jgi:succinylarginine dihydrolase